MSLNEVCCSAIASKTDLIDSDDLEDDVSSRSKPLLKCIKKYGPISLANRLQHFDGNDPVVGPGDIAVVFQFKSHGVLQARELDALPCECQLLGRKCDASHVCTGATESLGHRSPAAADLKYPFAPCEFQQVLDTVEFGGQGLHEA